MKQICFFVFLTTRLVFASSDAIPSIRPAVFIEEGTMMTVRAAEGHCLREIIRALGNQWVDNSGLTWKAYIQEGKLILDVGDGRTNTQFVQEYPGAIVPDELPAVVTSPDRNRFVITAGRLLWSVSKGSGGAFGINLKKQFGLEGDFGTPAFSADGKSLFAFYNPVDDSRSPQLVFLNRYLKIIRPSTPIGGNRYLGAQFTSLAVEPNQGWMYVAVSKRGQPPSLLCLNSLGTPQWEVSITSEIDAAYLIGKKIHSVAMTESGTIQVVVPVGKTETEHSAALIYFDLDGNHVPVTAREFVAVVTLH